jgi:hypothetical protein
VFAEAIKEKVEPTATSVFSAGTKLVNSGLAQAFELLLLPYAHEVLVTIINTKNHKQLCCFIIMPHRVVGFMNVSFAALH